MRSARTLPRPFSDRRVVCGVHGRRREEREASRPPARWPMAMQVRRERRQEFA